MDAVDGGAPGFAEFVSWGAFSAPVLPIVATLLGVGYLGAAVALWRRGGRWSIGRTVLFLLGCVCVVLVTGLAVEEYGRSLLSVFMFQQLTLMMLAPPLLLLGSPVRLLLRALPHGGVGGALLRLLLRASRSRVLGILLHPAVTVPLFLLSFYGLYLGGLGDRILALPFGHESLEVVFLLAGLLFAAPIVSSDPLPFRMGHGGRVVDVTAEIALHAFFGVFLMISPTLLVTSFAESTAALGLDPLADQALAGGLAWSYGEGPNAILLIFVLHRWFRDDTARARARDRRTDRDGDPELDAYNERLRRLRERDGDPT